MVRPKLINTTDTLKISFHTIVLSILFICCLSTSRAQSNFYLIDTTGINWNEVSERDLHNLDSILPLIHSADHDSTKVRLITYIAENCWNDEIWPKYNTLVIHMSDQNLGQGMDSLFNWYKANSISNVGYLFNSQGKSVLAIENYKASVALFESINDKKGMSTPLNNLGYTYKFLGDIEKALDYFHRSLDIKLGLGDEKGSSVVYNNLANLYGEQGDDSTAKSFYEKALEIGLKYDDIRSIGLAYHNLGHLLYDHGELDSALAYYEKALEIRKEYRFKGEMALTYLNMGRVMEGKSDTTKALEYYLLAYEITQSGPMLREAINTESSLGELYYKMGEIDKAKGLLESAHENSLKLGYPEVINITSTLLSNIYNTTGQHEKALEMYKLSITMRDSLVNLDNQKLAYREQIDHEFQQKENQRKLEEQQRKSDDQKRKLKEDQDKRTKNMVILFISIGLGLSIIFAFFLYNRFRVIKSQKLLIEDQKSVVDQQRNELVNTNQQLSQKNDLITDSIFYAKKIQNAILPTEEQFREHFEDMFIFYRPKDIVSGDFYWGYVHGNTILFTAADCTGHGVPGAFMSLIGSNILDKIVGELNIHRPDLILERMSEEIHRRLRSGDQSNVKDGMDLAICSVNLDTMELKMAGAYNPMYLIRNKELIQFKGDRYQIGNPNQINGRKFTLHEYKLEKNDTIYLFSDGFADQKGGPDGKKFYYPPFRDLLLNLSGMPMNQQKSLLETKLRDWKGSREQLDDILILGIRI